MFTSGGFFDRLDNDVDLIEAILREIEGSGKVIEDETPNLPRLRSVGHVHPSYQTSTVCSHVHHRLPDIGFQGCDILC
jgi:hypothetical protein